MDPVLFLHDVTFDGVPASAQHQTVRCLVDLCGAVVAERHTPLSLIVHDHTSTVFRGDPIDSFGIHDSHRESLGHAGVHVLAATLAAYELRRARADVPPTGAVPHKSGEPWWNPSVSSRLTQHSTFCAKSSNGLGPRAQDRSAS